MRNPGSTTKYNHLCLLRELKPVLKYFCCPNSQAVSYNVTGELIFSCCRQVDMILPNRSQSKTIFSMYFWSQKLGYSYSTEHMDMGYFKCLITWFYFQYVQEWQCVTFNAAPHTVLFSGTHPTSSVEWTNYDFMYLAWVIVGHDIQAVFFIMC